MSAPETMERKRPRPCRSFTAEFKADIVERCLVVDTAVNQVAGNFDLTVSAVRGWVKQDEIDAGARRQTTDEKEEPASLRRANRRLRDDFEILKRAMAFFAMESRRWRVL